jgi:hypothetical protein
VHDGGVRERQPAGDEHERLGRARGEQHLIDRATMPGRNRLQRNGVVGVHRQVGGPHDVEQPVGSWSPHVHREVDQPGCGLAVPVVVKPLEVGVVQVHDGTAAHDATNRDAIDGVPAQCRWR